MNAGESRPCTEHRRIGSCELWAHLEDVLYEIELEDMCEEGPSTWEDLANKDARMPRVTWEKPATVPPGRH